MSTKSYKVFTALRSAGVAEEQAYMASLKLTAPTTGISVGTKVAHKSTSPNASTAGLTDRIVSYSKSQRGNVWTLQGATLALGVNRNNISAALTSLCKEGAVSRTGRGEYRHGH